MVERKNLIEGEDQVTQEAGQKDNLIPREKQKPAEYRTTDSIRVTRARGFREISRYNTLLSFWL